MPNSALPAHLKGKRHTDWFWVFSWIPRAWTSFKLFQPPKVLIGYKVKDWVHWLIYDRKSKKLRGIYTVGPNPCQRVVNSWYIGFPWYFTWTIGKTGWYIRIGFRWDDIDRYYTFPSLAVKKIDGGLR